MQEFSTNLSYAIYAFTIIALMEGVFTLLVFRRKTKDPKETLANLGVMIGGRFVKHF